MMHVHLELADRLQAAYVCLDWRQVAERGLACFRHFHKRPHDFKTAPDCELDFFLKMSLEETGEQQADSKFSYSSATRRAGQFKCVGAIRKAGFLCVKKWIIKRRQSIELARKQGWKRYWVCLRGTALLFHSVIESQRPGVAGGEPAANNSEQIDLLSWIQANCSSQVNLVTNLLHSEQQASADNSRDAFMRSMAQCYIEREPRHLIIIDGSIAQPIPEHPRRDFVFCLSTTFGDAYLFQASCQLESDNWISAIHNACAASIARDLTRDEATKLFETKIRHFELEAEKKIFLRQRLESRLTSMSSMCHSSGRLAVASEQQDRYANWPASQEQDESKLTMRKLLQQLNQQLLALDTYIEQLHCEVYQLRCYLSSCGAQNLFYQNVRQQQRQDTPTSGLASLSNDLPHPKSLLMHVSKPTKLLLIKLGIFTVSSFHALMHARQDSAKQILDQIHQQTSGQPAAGKEDRGGGCGAAPPLELRIRSHSISETLLAKRDNAKLESETEDLLEIANLKTVSLHVAKRLLSKIKQKEDVLQQQQQQQQQLELMSFELSDDRCSIEDSGESICLKLKVNPSATGSSIVKQALRVLEPQLGPFEFLNYFLQMACERQRSLDEAASARAPNTSQDFYVIKRKETVADWTSHSRLELVEKMIFRVELQRSRTDEEPGTPFGICVEGQLFSLRAESQLNVYCNYIEWGSAADKAGLRDEDELLLMNGIPVAELDLMFVECILQEANKLRAVVRSSRFECPPKGRRLDMSTWRSLDPDDDDQDHRDDKSDRKSGTRHILRDITNQKRAFESAGSQVISDEYLTSLVCPPPPAKSSALLLQQGDMLRQKSDLGLEWSSRLQGSMSKSRSQHRIDATLEGHSPGTPFAMERDEPASRAVAGSADLAKQLMQKTERLSKLLGRHAGDELDRLSLNTHLSGSSAGGSSRAAAAAAQSDCQRLRKSILELIETEYAYIRHLETISEHYMSPLEEQDFLNIAELRALNQIVLDILCLQQEFFERLTSAMATSCQLDLKQLASDEFERLNKLVQQTETLKTADCLRPLVGAIARLFEDEADRFKLYGSYCVAYSKLQRILHPRKPAAGLNSRGPSVSSIPSALNTFLSSLHSSSLTSLGPFQAQQRALSLANEPSGSADQSALLKQLADFLCNLDSSSSSASLSLAKSSGAESLQVERSGSNPAANAATNGQVPESSNSANNSSASTQKNVHQQNFESYLIKPIQRLVKYPMLLNSIALALQAHESASERASSARSSSSSSSLQAAIAQMESVVNHVNDAQRVQDEYGAIFERIEAQFFAQQAFENGKNSLATLFGPHQPAISLDIAQLLHWGPVSWLNVAEFTSKLKRQQVLGSLVFVFASCVVFICKKQVKKAAGMKAQLAAKQEARLALQQESSRAGTFASFGEQEAVRYQTLIPVSEVQVRAVAQERQVDPAAGFEWELFQCSSSSSNSGLLSKGSTTRSKRDNRSSQPKATAPSGAGRRYLLSSDSSESRNVFLRKIRFTIRESVRNMSLPLGRSPSSKSFELLKKMSTSSATSVNSNTNVHSSLSQTTSLSPAEPEAGGATEKETQASACERFPAVPASRFESAIGVNS